MRKIILIAVVAVLMPLGLGAQGTSAMEARRAQLEREIAELNRQIRGLAGKKESAMSELELTRTKISARKELIAETESLIRALDDSVRVREQEAERLARRRDTLSVHYARLVRSAYINRDSRVWYMYILSSDNIGQAMRRYAYLRGFARNLNAQAAKISEITASLEEEMLRIRELRADAESHRNALMEGYAALKVEEAQSQRLLAGIEKDRARWERSIRDKNKQITALNREIAEAIRRASESSGSRPVDVALSADFASNKGRLPWPARGAVVEPFGQNQHPVYQNVTMPFNNGITMAVAEGTVAKAVFGGTVTRVAVIPGFNQCVLVQHGNYFTLYSKLKSVNVSKGDRVETGQAIGVVETVDGESRLHFELWEGRSPQNPALWLAR
ncbi:MAG: peptidoglycan DD-metalloendopeptidase family protein [Bacteroidales bacterium]|nr:peptidoglycan DD-metalloendopeptidase family protein [Bacteroidales bacterium]